jgi:hypothetical protein
VAQTTISLREHGKVTISPEAWSLLHRLKTLPRERLAALAAGTETLED